MISPAFERAADAWLDSKHPAGQHTYCVACHDYRLDGVRCNECDRWVCDAHTRDVDDVYVCVECAKKNTEPSPERVVHGQSSGG